MKDHMSSYEPKPIDITGVELPRELDSMREELARSSHDVWALSRFDDGWKYGTERNDYNKEHPCLVSYDDLPDNDKDLDRDSCERTLKSIYKLGFSIVRKPQSKIMLVGSYTEHEVCQIRESATLHNMDFQYFKVWAEARSELEKDILHWHAIILDVEGQSETYEKTDPYFLRNVLDDINAIFNRIHNEIPWYVLPNNNSCVTEKELEGIVGRHRKLMSSGNSGWGEWLHKMDMNGLDKLLYCINSVLPNIRNYKIKSVYRPVFDVLNRISPKLRNEVEEHLFGILQPLHYPEVYYSFSPEEYYNHLRKVLEALFRVCLDFQVIPVEIVYQDKGMKDQVNLKVCSDYLVENHSVCPPAISGAIKTIYEKGNNGSHAGGVNYRIDGEQYSVLAYSLQLCDVICWLGKCINEKKPYSLEMDTYEGKTVLFKKQDDDFVYERCIINRKDIESIGNDIREVTLYDVKLNLYRPTREKGFVFFARASRSET